MAGFCKLVAQNWHKNLPSCVRLSKYYLDNKHNQVYFRNRIPTNKVFSKKEANELFNRFEILAAEPNYFPVQFFRIFKTGSLIHKFLENFCDTLIYYLLKK